MHFLFLFFAQPINPPLKPTLPDTSLPQDHADTYVVQGRARSRCLAAARRQTVHFLTVYTAVTSHPVASPRLPPPRIPDSTVTCCQSEEAKLGSRHEILPRGAAPILPRGEVDNSANARHHARVPLSTQAALLSDWEGQRVDPLILVACSLNLEKDGKQGGVNHSLRARYRVTFNALF